MEGVKVINFRLSSETEELLSRIAQAEGKKPERSDSRPD